jgi:hypothetical protein
VLHAISKIENPVLEFLDVSYAKLVTDEGLKAFEDKTFKINHLALNGLNAVSSVGLYHPIYASRDTLLIYEGALMD